MAQFEFYFLHFDINENSYLPRSPGGGTSPNAIATELSKSKIQIFDIVIASPFCLLQQLLSFPRPVDRTCFYKPSLYYDVREGKPINILDFYFRNFYFRSVSSLFM